MSGGPVISKHSGFIDGYIVEGARTQEGSTDIKSFKFLPISNISEEYFKKTEGLEIAIAEDIIY